MLSVTIIHHILKYGFKEELTCSSRSISAQQSSETNITSELKLEGRNTILDKPATSFEILTSSLLKHLYDTNKLQPGNEIVLKILINQWNNDELQTFVVWGQCRCQNYYHNPNT